MGAHHHEHDHHHGHHHGHSHAPADFGRAFAVGIALNLAYVGAEAFYGVASQSLALLADAAHNLGDVLGLAAAWLAASLGKRKPWGRYTYGLRRASVLAALGNAVTLLVVTGGVAVEAVRRFWEPQAPAGLTIMAVGAVGIVVNGGTALMFMAGRHGDLNIRGAFLHMVADALVTAGTIAAGALILLTGWAWIDPVVSLAIGAVIVAGTWSLLRDAVNLSLDAIPAGIERDAVESYLRGLAGVRNVHDLHIWALSTTEVALTAHLVRDRAEDGDALLARIPHDMRERFGIGHVTIQLETEAVAAACALRPDHVV